MVKQKNAECCAHSKLIFCKVFLTLLARAVNNLITYARVACNEIRDLASSCWMQRQLKNFQRVRASLGSQMDVERIQKGKVCC